MTKSSKRGTATTPPATGAQTDVANGDPAPSSDRYDPQAIEQKWFQRWAQKPELYRSDPPAPADATAVSTGGTSARKKYYVLEMLPYPSGALHMGHVRNYSIGDALARYMWMQGYNVLHPMGWDSFGLPAENAAIANQTPPKEWTLGNIAKMKAQMKRLGFGYDWSKEVTTCLPEYYRWNQWFFLKLFERGLAYRKKSKVNWCPKCATVLANEQVLPNGCCWRHEDTQVEQRELEQWFLRITNYADELLQNLETLDGWPEKVRTMQRNWIGRSEGTLVDFKLDGAAGPAGDKISVFTTRVDTIYGATSLQLAPEHPIVTALTANNPELLAKVEDLIAEQRKAKEAGDIGAIEKRGVFTESYALNPFNDERVPIWVANYVLLDYGTGAIMSVPAHDQRDYEFAKKYDLDIKVVILPRRTEDPPAEGEPDEPVLPFTAMDSLLINSGEYSGLPCQEAIVKMSKYAEEHGFGKATVTYRLKDWGVSRQRYWGTPIPMIYCEACGIVPVPEQDLPVLLPDNVPITLAGGSPLGNVPEFVNVKCPKCGSPARRETDTMDTFVDSSWYFYRYTDPSLDSQALDSDTVGYWFPIDQYIGGVEHAILHLIYSRFWTKAMRDMGVVRNSEPAQRAVHARHGDQGRRQDVEEFGQRGLARRHGGALRRRFDPHVHAVRRAAGPRSRLAGCGRGRTQPILVAGISVRQAQREAGRSGVERQSRWTAFAGSAEDAAQVAPDDSARDGRLRRALALQYVDRGNHGIDERTLRLRRQRAARWGAGRSAVIDGRCAAQAGADAGAVRALSRTRVVGDAGRNLRSVARTVAAVRSRAGQRRGSRDRHPGERQDPQPHRRSLPTPPTSRCSALALADEKIKGAIAKARRS
jgi:leucyl-tRNA synthetase